MSSPAAPASDTRVPGGSPEPPRPAVPEPPRRPYALGLLLIGGGVVWGLSLLGVSLRWELILPVALIVIGAMLLLDRGGWSGGLVGLGIVVLVAAMLVVPFSVIAGDDIGERQEVVTDVSELDEEHRLGIGSLVLDLRGLALEDGDVVPVTASVGIGELRVRLPEGVSLTGDARVGIGAVQGTDGSRGGFGVDATLEDLQETNTDDPARKGAPPMLDLDLQVGIGQVVVTR